MAGSVISRVTIASGRRRGQLAATKFTATLEGGPELAAALATLDDIARVRVAKDALLAGGAVIAQAWADRVPVLDGIYRDALTLPGTVKAGKTKAGASGSIGPRRVAGVPDDEQPIAYAGRLEYGDASRAAQPSARPAFDASAQRAVDAAGDVIRAAVAAKWPGA